MVFTVNELNEAIGAILSKTGVTDVKNVIGTYDQSKSAKENIKAIIEAHKKDKLFDTVTFLKGLSTDYPVSSQQMNPKSHYKEDYATDIVSFINLLKPTQCLACSTNYVPTGEDYNESQVKCFICSRPSHHNCFNDSNVKPEIGLVFLCSECISEKTAKDLTESAKIAPEPPAIQPPPPNEPNKVIEKDEEETVVDNNINDQRNDKDCPMYLKRLCPHGLTGKRHVNGKPCPYKHRILCRYFMEYGPTGCRYKRQCRFLHPRVCENSLKLKTCLNRSCTEFHLKGTQRKSHSQNDHGNNMHQFRQNDPVKPWMQNTTLNTNSKTTPQQNPPIECTKDFLEKYLQEMKADLMKEFTRSTIQNVWRANTNPATINQSQIPHREETYQSQQNHQFFNQPQRLPTQNQQFLNQPMSLQIHHPPA